MQALTKKQIRKIELEKHYKRCEQLALSCGIVIDGKKLSNKLWALETIAHTRATEYCNGVIDCDKWEEVSQTIEDEVQSLFKNNLKGLFINGDARGYALKINDEITTLYYNFLHKDWGGYGILSPTIE